MLIWKLFYRMPTIQGTSFKPVSPLSNAELVNVCMPGTGNVAARALQEKKLWDASPTFFFFTHLGSDNKKINSCYLSILGSWQSDIIISTHRFCPALDEESFLTIKDLDLSQFKLDENLVSQCIPISSLEPVIVLEGEKVTWEDYIEQGGREMCIRAHVTPMSDHTARLSFMLVPESLEDLNTLSCVAGLVPGFSLTSKELAISPAARFPWGLAFVTLLIKGDPTKDVGQVDQLELRRAIHKVLQGSIIIKACRQMESYKKRLEKLKSGEVSDPVATDLWPEIQGATDHNSGRNFYLQKKLY